MNSEHSHITILFDGSDKPIGAAFGHLPRPGDTINHNAVNYEVEKIVFNLVGEAEGALTGHPQVFCRMAARSLGGDSGA